MRRRGYILEITTSGAIPAIVKPFAMVRRARPTELSGVVSKLRKKRKRLIKRMSRQFSPDLIARI